MSEAVFSPIKLNDIYLIESNFSTKSEVIDKNGRLDISFDTPEPEITTEGDDYLCSVSLGVTINLVGDDHDYPSLVLHTKMIADLALPVNIMQKDEAHELLWTNGISMVYAHIRSYMLNLTSISRIPNIVIPPIYPGELIKAVRQNKQ